MSLFLLSCPPKSHLNDRAPGKAQETGLGPLHSPPAFRARPYTFSSPEQHKWLPPQWAQRWKCHYTEREIRGTEENFREMTKHSWDKIQITIFKGGWEHSENKLELLDTRHMIAEKNSTDELENVVQEISK